MQKIERYGVIALVFLLVTILAVSLWGESKDGGLFFWKKDGAGADKQAQADRPRPRANATGLAPGQAPRAAEGDAAAQPGARGLALSPENADPAAAQARAERIALMQQRRAERAAAQNALPTPGGAQVGETAATPAATQLPTPGQAGVAQTPGQPVGAPAVPVGQGTLVRSGAAPLTPGARANAGGVRSYVVKNGDTLGEIARRELGASRRWNEIAALNGNIDPTRLRVGATLTLPAGGAPAVSAAPAATGARTAGPAREYTVRNGDTLSAIAARELGDAERWPEIAALNPSLNPARMSVGALLALPAGGAAAGSSRPAALDQRRSVASAPRPQGKSKVQ